MSRRPLSHAFVVSLGSSSTAPMARLIRTGTTISTQAVTSRRAQPDSADGSSLWPGSSRRSVGPMCEYRSGTPVASERMW